MTALASTEITSALTHVMSSIEALTSTCRDRGIDPMTVITTMMFGGGGVSQAAAIPPVVDVESRSLSGPVPTPSDAELVQHSHDLIDAIGRAELASVATTLAPGFVRFHDGAAIDRETLLTAMMQRRSQVPYIATRRWEDDRVVRKGDVLVFSGKAHEVQGGNDLHGGYIFDGWYLVQWIWTGDAWRAQLLTWQKELTERDRWNEIFDQGRGFSREPNRLLVETVKDQTPGIALDLATGQGRNALYLASQGWQVTGVDAAEEGLRRAREQALARNLALETIVADLDDWDPGADRYDLVTLMYAGDHAKWIDKIKASLRAGGLVVVEGWAKESPDSPAGFGEGQLAKLFDGYEIVRDETIDDVPDWGWDRGKLVRFVARKRSPLSQ